MPRPQQFSQAPVPALRCADSRVSVFGSAWQQLLLQSLGSGQSSPPGFAQWSPSHLRACLLYLQGERRVFECWVPLIQLRKCLGKITTVFPADRWMLIPNNLPLLGWRHHQSSSLSLFSPPGKEGLSEDYPGNQHAQSRASTCSRHHVQWLWRSVTEIWIRGGTGLLHGLRATWKLVSKWATS